ncbi:MAG: GIY-YIG nuclease family protein [Minisyncoccia bacterium]
MYYVYILKNKTNHFYIGTTEDLKRRLQEHTSGNSYFTQHSGPCTLVWYCAFLEKKKAYEFETYLKSSSGFAFRNKRLV